MDKKQFIIWFINCAICAILLQIYNTHSNAKPNTIADLAMIAMWSVPFIAGMLTENNIMKEELEDTINYYEKRLKGDKYEILPKKRQ